ncbi:MAG: DUF4276 family protein [Gemmatimonadota bacterium]|uniref:DUF4276 family protein n=1 Tax=Candidatus Palauibacter scopulicola TaxID=3056741 RepID=UPI002397C7BD|nr:DUF4276 family protein [Candidatus Palauibacter scopulicola]MDE2664416.1 DUF4276 family protein [Candidatus Palauibacter scopulicola]
MTRLAISVEGQTEEEFVKDSLAVHLQGRGVDVRPVMVGRARGRGQGGGNVSIGLLAREMRALKASFDAVTSLVDFYGFRGKGTMSADDLLRAIRESLGPFDERFVFPYVQMHEFEGLLFSNVDAFAIVLPEAPVADLRSIRSEFDTPEDINDSPTTAPSKRIKRLIPSYRKRLDGPPLAAEIGLNRIRSECPRFDAWLRRLESLGEPAT